MKDNLGNLFRERFHGHEVPVAPGTWQAIQNQMTAAPPAPQEPAPGQLHEKFAGHEVHVDPAVWQSISTQIGHGVAAGTTGVGFMGGLGWAAAGVAGLLVAAGLIYVLNSDGSAARITPAPVEVSAKQPRSEPTTEVAHIAPTMAPGPEEVRPMPPNASRVQAGKAVGNSNETAAANGRTTIAQEQPADDIGTQNAAVPDQLPGEDVVRGIIQQMTSEVEQEVRSDNGVATAETVAVKPPVPEVLMPGVQLAEPTPLPKLFLPNVFTPNGDNVNDVYQVTSEGSLDIKMRVFSVKSNQLVFSTNTNEPWTGANCEDGYYMVAVEATAPDGRMVTGTKVVWLNRNSTN